MPYVSTNEIAFAIYISILNFTEGAHFTLVPNIVRKIYGEQNATTLYGFAFSFTSTSAIALLILQKSLLTDEVSTYNIFWYACAACNAISLTILLTLFKE